MLLPYFCMEKFWQPQYIYFLYCTFFWCFHSLHNEEVHFILFWLIFNDRDALEICHLLLCFCSSRILNNLLALVTPDKLVRLMKSIHQPLAPPVFGGEESGSLIYIMQWKWTKSIALAKTEKEIRMINEIGRCAVFALMNPWGCVQM